MAPRTSPPFRADHVGSLLRPEPLKEARAKRDKGEITAEELAQVEDREIDKVIRTHRCARSWRCTRRSTPSTRR